MKTPQGFSEIFARLSHELPQNQTVMDLSFDYKGQLGIMETLREWRQTNFLPLISVGSNARISLPLYAGDGLIVKITPRRYEPREPLPYALPHFRNTSVDGQYTDYWVTAYPMVDVSSITPDDVVLMKEKLKQADCAFQPQDDRVDNLGRLPNGDVCA